MAEFHFLRPLWFLAILPLVLLLWFLWRRNRRAGQWATVCDARLLPHILIQRNGRRSPWPLTLFATGGVLAVTALAGPAWEQLPTPVFRTESYLVIALDLSRSMDAADLKPSRVARARFKIEDILRQRKDGQTALVVYAGDAFAVTPLTDDTETLRHQLAVLSPSIMPVQGSNAEAALNAAGKLLKQAGAPNGHVLLITDGVNTGSDLDAARALRAQSYQTSVLGMGTGGGAPIPLAAGGFLKDQSGHIVVPKLKPEPLQRLASAGDGRYRRITSDSADIEYLLTDPGKALDARQERAPGLKIERWVEEGPWLVLPLLLIAAFAFRRGLLCVLLLLFLPVPDIAYAFEWRDLWASPDQRASRAFSEENFDEAAERFRDPEWKSAAQYKAKRYRHAAKTLENINTPEAHYNRGNALAKLGQFPEALDAYEKALKLDPANADARYNKDLVEKLLRQNRQRQQGGHGGGQGNQTQANSDNSGQQGADSGSEHRPAGQSGKEAQKETLDTSSSSGSTPKPQGGQPGASNETRKTPDAGSLDGTDEDGETGSLGKENSEPEEHGNSANPMQSEGESSADEESQQASEQWLRRIPDDPGGLLRRKFEYQYKRRNYQRNSESETW